MCETAMAVAQLETDDHQPENGFVSPETTSPALLSRIDGCVLPFLGGFGKYQKQLIVLTWIPALFIGFSQFSDSFLLAQPNNTCVLPMINSSNLTLSPSSLFNGQNNSGVRAPYLSNGTRHNNTDDAQCRCTQWRYEMQMGLRENVVTKWNLVCDSKRKVHIAKFSLLVGSIFGYLVMGILADWFGRHPVLIISVLFMLVFGLTVAFSVNVPMFSTLRFFEGFCLAGISLSLYVLRIELCLPGWRFSMTMVANFVVLGGQLLMPGVAVLCRDWQVLQAVIICPLFLMLSYICLFPESLRWLLATQQFCRSKRLITRIAKKNKANLERDADDLLTELHQALQKKPKRTCIVKMVGTRNLWKNIVVLCVNSLTGYGIHHCFARSMMYQEAQETTMFHNFYADYYVMAGIAVASCIALCPAVGLMGRRGGLLMFMIITALASLLQLGLLNLLGKYSVQLNIERSDTLKTNFSVAFSIIGMFSSHAVSNLSIFFCAEITPTVIRGGGLGLVLASAGFGMLTAPIMELHDQKGYFLHHVIFACCTLICIICILLLPETRYQPLPETLADGESYTRQPLLPPRKPGEQHFLLTKSDSRDYARVHDTPLHEAAATAVSTMDSTASSAIDITLPSGYVEEDVATQAAADSAVHLNAKPAAVGDVEPSPAVPVVESLTTDDSTEDHPVEGQPALDATEPIELTSIEPELPQDSSTPLLTSSTRTPKATSPIASSPRIGSPRVSSPRMESPRDSSPRTGSPRDSSPRAGSPRDSSPRTGSPRDSSPRTGSPRDGSPRASSPRHTPVIPDLIPALSTAPPDTEAVSPVKIEPPATVLITDSVPVAKSDSPGPDLSDSSLPHPLACAALEASSPAAESPPAPVASDPDSPPDMETDVSLVNDTTAPSAGDIPSHGLTDPASSPAHLVNDLLVSPSPPITDSSTPPAVDGVQLTLVDSPIPPSIDGLPATIPPIPPSSPPLTRDSPSPSPVIPPSPMDPTTAPGSTTTWPEGAAASPLPLPLVDWTTPLVTDTSQDLAADSATASPPPSPPGTPPSFSMDCTVSSPIDSGLTAADAATANGVASS